VLDGFSVVVVGSRLSATAVVRGSRSWVFGSRFSVYVLSS
jgi:hypothetical protein